MAFRRAFPFVLAKHNEIARTRQVTYLVCHGTIEGSPDVGSRALRRDRSKTHFRDMCILDGVSLERRDSLIDHAWFEVWRDIDRCGNVQACEARPMPFREIKGIGDPPLSRWRPVDMNQDIFNHNISSARRDLFWFYMVGREHMPLVACFLGRIIGRTVQ